MGGQGSVRTPLPALCPGIPTGQPAAPGRAPAPPAAGCSKRLGGSRCALWGSQRSLARAGTCWVEFSLQAGLASGTPNAPPPFRRHVLVSFKGLETPFPGH